MKVTQVALRPTSASDEAGRPALTPELLAASGARYSRSNDGLEAILSKIDPDNLDRSVDSIFKMIDYGHQSIADMVPVAIFIDQISLWLAYHVWTLCPTAGGQESSTRYINYQSAQNFDAAVFDIPSAWREAWQLQVRESFAAYDTALKIWEEIAQREPGVMRLPQNLLDDSSEKAQKQVARMRRNYAFDRARNFLPTCAPTNMMMIQSARAWATLCQHLCSHVAPEAQTLGARIREELELAAPRMTRHAAAKPSMQSGAAHEFELWQKLAQNECAYLENEHSGFANMDNGTDEHGTNIRSTSNENRAHEHPPTPFLSVDLPRDVIENDITESLQFTIIAMRGWEVLWRERVLDSAGKRWLWPKYAT
jgi:thymidylate synthase ThyX